MLSDTAVEPALAVDPVDPSDLFATWMTAEFQVYGGAVSGDGGATWKQVMAPGLTHCTGGPADASDDPGVSFGGGGNAYLSTQANDPAPEAILVSRSADGGQSWSAPVVVDRANTNDKQRSPVAVDPANPTLAFLTWTRLRGPEAADVYFSASKDAGASWSPATPAYVSLGADLRPLHNLVHVLADHSLVDSFVQLNTASEVNGLPRRRDQLLVIRSTDDGLRWSAPVEISDTSDLAPRDPDNGKPVSAEPVLQSAVAADGTLWAAWNDIASIRASRVLIARSRDGGKTWTAPVAVAEIAGQAFLPTLAIDRDGTVGVAWYDTRNDRPGDSELTADYWFAYSQDAGRSWRQAHVAGPFDLRSAYVRPGAAGAGAGYFLGDYVGLDALPDGFAAAFAAPQPLAGHGMSSIYFARIRLINKPATCGSRRSFVIHLRASRSDPLRDATVRVDGRRVRVLYGRPLRARIDLRGLPHRRVVVSIVAHTRQGRTLRARRIYHPCTARLPARPDR